MPKNIATLPNCDEKLVLLGSCSVPSQVVPHCTPGGGEGQWQGENYSYFTFTFLQRRMVKRIFSKAQVSLLIRSWYMYFSLFLTFTFPHAGKEIGQRMNFCGGDNIFQMDWVHGGKSSKQIILFGEIYVLSQCTALQ